MYTTYSLQDKDVNDMLFAEPHLLQTVYMRLTVEMRKGSFLERVRLLLSVPRPSRW